VLQLKDAKDPDEYLKKFGADKFRLLLNDSSNRVEYQLNAIRKKYDLGLDDQRVKFIAEAAEFVSTLTSAVQREIYGNRVAEAAGISFDAMKIEVNKAFKRRIAREKKKQERIDLAPAANLQPKSRNIRYDNVKSAMAEETVLAMILKSPALLDQAKDLRGEQFSSKLLGRVYNQFVNRHKEGLDVTISGLEDFSGEEMSHIAGIIQHHTGPISEAGFADCVRTILAEYRKSNVSSEEDLMAIREKMKNRKGIRG
jgi:DNA primase